MDLSIWGDTVNPKAAGFSGDDPTECLYRLRMHTTAYVSLPGIRTLMSSFCSCARLVETFARLPCALVLLLVLNTLTKSHLGEDVIWLILPGRNPSPSPSPRELRARTHGRNDTAGLFSGSPITSFSISFLKYNSGPPAQE